MNTLMKASLKAKNLKSLLTPLKSIISTNGGNQSLVSRNIWYMCNLQNNRNDYCYIGKKFDACNSIGNYRYELYSTHNKAEKELVEFLTEEILAERKSQKMKTIPTEIDGFKAQLNGAEVTLTKQTDSEMIKINFNVNHTVDTDAEPEVHPNMEKPDIGEMKSKPTFRVDVIRANTTVSLVCSFLNENEQDEAYNDIFGIDEISIYNGEWNENVYAVSGEVVDTYLYDLLLNYLEEKGISNEFVEKLSAYSTSFEHSAYISLLEGLSKFASGK